MRNTSSALLVAILALGVFAAGTVRADEAVTSEADADSSLAAILHQLAKNYAAAYDREDVEATLRIVHTRSPEYATTREQLDAQFDNQDVETEVASFQYIGHDDEFAYARVKIRTVDSGEAEFTDNTIDTVTLFHREDGVWKVWSDFILGIELIEGR